MKKLFLSAIALTLGAFAFMSCEDEKKTEQEEEKGRNESYLTAPEQQERISSAFNGMGEAIDFTNVSNVVTGIVQMMGGLRIDPSISLAPIFEDTTLLKNQVFAEKLAVAMGMVGMFGSDSVVLDLEPLYMSADIYVTDTVVIDSSFFVVDGGGLEVYYDTIEYALFSVANFADNDRLSVNIYKDGHKMSVNAKAKAGQSSFREKDTKEQKDQTIVLPQFAEVSITLDDMPVLILNGNLDTDFRGFVNKDEDTESFDWSYLNLNANLQLVDYLLNANISYREQSGISGGLTASFNKMDLFSLSGNVDASFADFDFSNISDTTVLLWAQNPQMLRKINLEASLGGKKVQIKGDIENPFKDSEVASRLRTLMIPGTTLTPAQSKATIEKLNSLMNVGVYFEGYKNAQATLKFIYFEEPDAPRGTKGAELDDEDEDSNPIAAVLELLERAGAMPVMVVHDKDGKEVEMPLMEYFGKIDIQGFTQQLMGKFMQTFGALIPQGGDDDVDFR